MGALISCSCGYSGPGQAGGQGLVCPLCGEPAAGAAEEKKWRVPCPKGHVFRAPESWMGRKMVCPQCNESFILQISDSLEKKEELRRRQEQEEAKFAKMWLNRAIAAAVLFGLLLVAMIVMSVIKG
ncbi:MAG: hypothetical protein ACKO1M_09780 [Planctomycetota bacterium]